MTEIWYRDPSILLKNIDQFYPNNLLDRNQKINSIVRFAIYYTTFIIKFKYTYKYLVNSVPF